MSGRAPLTVALSKGRLLDASLALFRAAGHEMA